MIDQTTDKNHSKLHYLYNAVKFPTFVKEAELDVNPSELPTTAFADRINRVYPIDSPANTWLSHLYFSKYATEEYNEYELERINNIFKEAAKLWKIDLNYKFTERFLKESAEIKEPIIKYRHENTILAEVHICAPEDLQKTADDILNNYDKYTYTIRRDVARQILKTAEDMNIELNTLRRSSLEKTAGFGVGLTDSAVNMLSTRKNLLKTNPEVCKKIDEAITMTKQADKDGILKPITLQKIAGFIDAIDRLTDLHHPFLTTAPEQNLFSMTVQDNKNLEKHAVVLSNNKLISRNKLHNNKEAVDKYLKAVCNTDSISKITAHEADGLLKILL